MAISFINGFLSGVVDAQAQGQERPVQNSNPNSDQKVDFAETSIEALTRVPVGVRNQSQHDELVRCNYMEAGGNDGNDYDKDRGATDSSGWSNDSRWEEAARLREIGRAYDQNATKHIEEALANAPGSIGILGKPYTALGEVGNAFSEKMTAQDYYNLANRLENQIGQDASRDMNDSGFCVIL